MYLTFIYDMEPFAESEIPLRYTRKNGWVKKKIIMWETFALPWLSKVSL